MCKVHQGYGSVFFEKHELIGVSSEVRVKHDGLLLWFAGGWHFPHTGSVCACVCLCLTSRKHTSASSRFNHFDTSPEKITPNDPVRVNAHTHTQADKHTDTHLVQRSNARRAQHNPAKPTVLLININMEHTRMPKKHIITYCNTTFVVGSRMRPTGADICNTCDPYENMFEFPVLLVLSCARIHTNSLASSCTLFSVRT